MKLQLSKFKEGIKKKFTDPKIIPYSKKFLIISLNFAKNNANKAKFKNPKEIN